MVLCGVPLTVRSCHRLFFQPLMDSIEEEEQEEKFEEMFDVGEVVSNISIQDSFCVDHVLKEALADVCVLFHVCT